MASMVGVAACSRADFSGEQLKNKITPMIYNQFKADTVYSMKIKIRMQYSGG